MIGWLIAAVYMAGFVYTARRVAGVLIAKDQERGPDRMDGEMAVLNRALGLILGLAWPLVAVGAIVTGRLPRSPAVLRRENEVMQLRIAELERNLGIGPGGKS